MDRWSVWIVFVEALWPAALACCLLLVAATVGVLRSGDPDGGWYLLGKVVIVCTLVSAVLFGGVGAWALIPLGG